MTFVFNDDDVRTLKSCFYNGDDGQSIVEMAVVIPVLCLLLFGLFQFALALTSYLGDTYAIRSAARYGSTHSLTSSTPASVCDIQAMVLTCPFAPAKTATTVNVGYVGYQGSAVGNYVGEIVQVKIQYSQGISLVSYSHTFGINNTALRFIAK